jgi:hypothetical protein
VAPNPRILRPDQLARLGLDRLMDKYDCGEDLEKIAALAISACQKEKQRISAIQTRVPLWPGSPPPELTELLALLHVQHIAVLARAMTLLHWNRRVLSGTGSPVKYLSRPLFESLAYLAYLLSADTAERSMDYITSQKAMSEWMAEKAAGTKHWHRDHGRGDGRLLEVITPVWARGSDGQSVNEISPQMDVYESEWLRRASAACDTSLPARKLKRASLDELRKIWLDLGQPQCSHHVRRDKYREREGVWSLMASWTAGVRPKSASRLANLQTHYLAQEVPDESAAESLMTWSNLESANIYSHASPFNVGANASTSLRVANRAQYHALLMLAIAFVETAKHYDWGRSLLAASMSAASELGDTALREGLSG